MGQPVIELHRPPACSGLGSKAQRSAVELGSLGQIGQMLGAGRMLERLLYSRVDSKYCGTLATSDEESGRQWSQLWWGIVAGADSHGL